MQHSQQYNNKVPEGKTLMIKYINRDKFEYKLYLNHSLFPLKYIN